MKKLLMTVLALGALSAATADAHHRGYVYGHAAWGPWLGPVWVPGPPPNRGFIDTDIQPEDAAVYVDGKRIGEADDFDGFPELLALRPGKRTIEFRHKGYRSLVVEVDLKRGWLLQLDDELEKGDPEDRDVHRSGPPARDDEMDDDDGDDDQPRRRRQYSDDEEDATEPSSYQRSDRAPARERPGARPGDAPATARGSSGIVHFDVDPDDASVYVDGEYQGSVREIADQGGLALSAGDHAVAITKEGFEPRELEVSVSARTTSEVSVALERERAS